MRLRDAVRLAAGVLVREPRRSGLSLIGMAVGVAAVVILTAVGQGARGFVARQFESLGSRTVAILPGRVETSGGLPGFGGVPNDLTLEDGEVLLRGVPGVERAVPIVVANDLLEANGRSRAVAVVGSVPEFLEFRGLELRFGRGLTPGPWDRGGAEVILGSKLAEELFPDGQALGGRVRLGGWRLRVVGVIEPSGLTVGVNMDEAAVIPVTTAMRMFDRSSLFRLALELRPGTDPEAAQRRVRELLLERHGEEDFTVTTPDAIVGALDKILESLSLALAGIAAVSLAVAGVGIMNVMLVSVSERKGEIGLYAALGAARHQVLTLFLVEAALMSGAGGLSGLLLGTLGARLAQSLLPTFPVAAPWWSIVAAFGTALVTGLVFGLLPARRATRLDPVEALAGGAR